MIELNKIHHLDNREGLPLLPEKCASLIIADPPYFEVKGEFDFVWSSFDEYLSFMEEQAKLYKQVLAENGTLFVYGHAKRIAYVQVIFDRYFGLVNNLVWEKAESDGLFGTTGSKELRSFPNSTERILMYSNEVMRTGLKKIKFDVDNFTTLRGYFKRVQDFIGTGKRNIIDKLGQKADHCFRHGSTQWEMPSSETYSELILHFGIKKMPGFIEYEALLVEYEALQRPFNNVTRSTEVLKFRFKFSKFDHDTVKPEKLSKTLILTCSRPGDLVVVPFAGSGTECAIAAKEGRQFVGFETTLKYVEMANSRVHEATRQGTLFFC